MRRTPDSVDAAFPGSFQGLYKVETGDIFLRIGLRLVVSLFINNAEKIFLLVGNVMKYASGWYYYFPTRRLKKVLEHCCEPECIIDVDMVDLRRGVLIGAGLSFPEASALGNNLLSMP